MLYHVRISNVVNDFTCNSMTKTTYLPTYADVQYTQHFHISRIHKDTKAMYSWFNRISETCISKVVSKSLQKHVTLLGYICMYTGVHLNVASEGYLFEDFYLCAY